jgi:hypothetical protein
VPRRSRRRIARSLLQMQMLGGWLDQALVDLPVAMLQKLDAPAVQRLRDVTPEP